MLDTSTRNATLQDLAAMLQDQQARKLDVVASSTAIRAEGGLLVIDGTADPVITDDGVTSSAGRYRPTEVCDSGISQKLGIPVAYLRKMRSDASDLYDANVNGWLHGSVHGGPGGDGSPEPIRPADPRKFLVRCFRGDDSGDGIARAFLSDSFRIIDHLDALTAALDGVKQADVPVKIDGCDLTDRRMYVRVVCEEVRALAPTLLRNYRSPFTGQTGIDNPVVFSGFVISNSETGSGQFSITPRMVVQVCKNGLTINADAVSRLHIGSRMEEGIIRWSEDTQQKNLELITAQARDAVATFLDIAYVQRKLTEMEEKAGVEIGEPEKIIRQVGKQLTFTEQQTNDVLSYFIRGADLTAGGVMHAVTAAAQRVPDGDTAFDMEVAALRAMELAASMSR